MATATITVHALCYMAVLDGSTVAIVLSVSCHRKRLLILFNYNEILENKMSTLFIQHHRIDVFEGYKSDLVLYCKTE